MEGEYKEEYKEKLELKDLPKHTDESFIHVECPSCRSKVRSAEININDKIAKCGSCDVVFSFSEQLPSDGVVEHVEEMARPEGVELIHYKNELELIIKQPYSVWHASSASLMPIVALFAFLIYFTKGEGSIYVGIVALLIAAFSALRLLESRRRHRIYFNASSTKLKVEWRPNKLIKDKVFDVDEIEQFYVRMAETGISLFAVVNSLNGQKHQKVMGRFRSFIEAKYVEQELEKYLGIPNKKITGEL